MTAGAYEAFSAQENDAFAQMLLLASSIDNNNTIKMTTASPLAQGRKYVAKGQHTTTSSYTTNVPCGLQELHNFIKAEDTSSRYTESSEEAYNDHHSIQFRTLAFPNPVSDRETHTSVITKVEDEKVIMISVPCFIEEKANERPLRSDRVRAELWSMYKLTKLSDSITRVEFYANVELAGYIPRWIINRELPKFMSAPTRWQEHFQHFRALRELGTEDGVAMGTMLTLVKNRKSVESRLTAFVSKNAALNKLKATFPHNETIMLGILRNKIVHVRKRKRAAAKVGIDLDPGRATTLQTGTDTATAGSTLRELSEKDAAKIGNSFAMFLLTSTEPKLAVDAWRLENSALQPLFDEHQFFEPMMQTISKRLLASGNLGLKMRVFLGAFL